MHKYTSLLAGAIFGVGLTVSGMVNPAKVIGFLDVAGSWDPTLIFVMGGALIPMGIAWMLVSKMTTPLIGDDFKTPVSRHIDRRLIIGATLFGIGWGLVGICPGPGLAALTFGNDSILVFVAMMFIGMGLHRSFMN